MGIVIDFLTARHHQPASQENKRCKIIVQCAEPLDGDFVKITATETGAFSFLSVELLISVTDYVRLQPQQGDVLSYVLDAKTWDCQLYQWMRDVQKGEGAQICPLIQNKPKPK